MGHRQGHASAGHRIKIRTIKPDYHRVDNAFWFDSNPYTTHMINALSFHFPAGEEMFVKSVNSYRSRIQDSELLRAIKAFAGQESMHGKSHHDFNQFLAAKNPKIHEYYAEISRMIDQRYDHAAKRWPLVNLAATVALEHMTATIAAQVLKRRDILEKMHPEVRALMIWHAIEEIEHKAVAFDVYRAVGGSYLLRILMMVATTSVLSFETLRYQLKMLRDDKQLSNIKAGLSFLRETCGRQGFFLKLLPQYLRYFKPGFHPSQQNDEELLAYWSHELPRLTPTRIMGRESSQAAREEATA